MTGPSAAFEGAESFVVAGGRRVRPAIETTGAAIVRPESERA